MDLWDIIKKNDLHVTGVPEGEEKEKEAESLFTEIMAECFPNMRKDLDKQIHETNRSPLNLNRRQSFTGHIIKKDIQRE